MTRMCFFRLRRGLLPVVSALLSLTQLHAFTPDFSKCYLKPDSKQASFWIFGPNKEFVGGAAVNPKNEFPNFKVSLENNALVIDTRGIYRSGVAGRSMTLRFYQVDLTKAYKAPADRKNHSMTNRISVELKSETPTEMVLFFEGQQEVNGKKKHYWVAKNLLLNGKWQTVSFDQVLPDSLNNLCVRVDLRKPAKIAIRRVTFEQVPVNEKKLDPTKNYIRNGGAENGWNGVFHNALRNHQLSSTGKYKESAFKQPSRLYFLTDLDWHGWLDTGFESPYVYMNSLENHKVSFGSPVLYVAHSRHIGPLHLNAANILFFDGHVGTRKTWKGRENQLFYPVGSETTMFSMNYIENFTDF